MCVYVYVYIYLFFLLLILPLITGVLKTTVPVITFEDGGADSALQFLCHNGDPKNPRFDKWLYMFCLAKIFDIVFFSIDTFLADIQVPTFT